MGWFLKRELKITSRKRLMLMDGSVVLIVAIWNVFTSKSEVDCSGSTTQH